MGAAESCVAETVRTSLAVPAPVYPPHVGLMSGCPWWIRMSKWASCTFSATSVEGDGRGTRPPIQLSSLHTNVLRGASRSSRPA